MTLPILLALAAGLHGPAANANAISTDEYRKLPECRLSADGLHLAQEPCRTAPARKNMPRRPVPLNVVPTPRIAPAPDPSLSWAPILTRRDPLAAPSAIARLPRAGVPTVPAPVAPLPGPGAPIPVTCDAGGCRDASGTYYHGPPGQVIGPGGKVCSTSNGWMTCY